MAKIINSEEFENIIAGDKPVMVDFYADWCGPCRMVAPTIEALSAERDDAVIVKVNVDNTPELAVRFGVSSIPTILVFRGGELFSRAVGVRSKDELIEMLG